MNKQPEYSTLEQTCEENVPQENIHLSIVKKAINRVLTSDEGVYIDVGYIIRANELEVILFELNQVITISNFVSTDDGSTYNIQIKDERGIFYFTDQIYITGGPKEKGLLRFFQQAVINKKENVARSLTFSGFIKTKNKKR